MSQQKGGRHSWATFNIQHARERRKRESSVSMQSWKSPGDAREKREHREAYRETYVKFREMDFKFWGR